MKPEEFDKLSLKGGVAPLYFVYGEEEFLSSRAVSRAADILVDPAFRDFNLTTFYGKECRAVQLMDTAQTMPMFADRRVILVKRAEEIPAEQLEALIPYISSPSPDSVVIFHAVKADMRRRFFLELKKQDYLVEYKKMKDEQLPPFAAAEMKRLGKRMDSEAAEVLVYFIGNSLREIVSQSEKLASYVGGREKITVDDVRAIVSDTKTDTAFELADALGHRDIQRGARQLQNLLRDSDAPYMLVGAIAGHFRKLCIINEMTRDRATNDEISKQTKIPQFFLKGMLGQAKRFTLRELVQILGKLHDLDVGMKSGGKPAILLETLLFDICLKK